MTGEDWGGLPVMLAISPVGVTLPDSGPPLPASSRLTGLVWGGTEWPRSRGAGPAPGARLDTGGRLG